MLSIQQKQILIPAVLFLLNIVVKGFFITSNSIAGDEPFSIYHAQMDVFSIMYQLAIGNNPPLYEILLHFWIELFGISPLSVRFPSLLFSSITVLFIYQLGKKFFNQKVACYASLFFVFSNYHIFYAHEARVYALMAMLSVISMYYYLKIVVSHQLDRYVFIMLVMSNILLIYSHYFGFFILFIQWIYFITHQELRLKYWRIASLATIITVVFYFPNIKILMSRFLDSSSKGTWLGPVSDLGNLHDVFHTFSNNNTLIYLIFLFMLWSSVGFWIYKKKFNSFIKIPLLIFLLPLFFLTGISFFIDMPFIWRVTSQPAYIFFFLAILLVLLYVGVFYKPTVEMSSQFRVIVFWFWFPFLLMFIVSLKYIPGNTLIFLDRYLMLVSVAFYIQLAILSDYIIQKKTYQYIIPFLLLGCFVATSNPNLSNRKNAKEAIEYVDRLRDGKTIVYFSPSWFDLNFIYYYDIRCFKNVKMNNHECLSQDNIFPISNQQEIRLNQLKKFDRIIFLDAGADFSFPGNGILQILEQHAVLKKQHDFQDLFKVYEFKP